MIKVGSPVVFHPKVYGPKYGHHYDEYQGELFEVIAFHYEIDEEGIAMFTKLKEQLESFPKDSEDDALFRELFEYAQNILGVTDSTLAGIFKVSRPTVGRWRSGRTAPHPVGRKPVMDTLAQIVGDLLKSDAFKFDPHVELKCISLPELKVKGYVHLDELEHAADI